MLAARPRGNGSGPARQVVVVSDQMLVADTVAAALNSRGFRARHEVWPVIGGLPMARTGSEIGVALMEAPPAEHADAVAALVAAVDIPWIVLSSAPTGRVWDAVLETGRVVVLPRNSSLEDLVTALLAAAD